MCNGRQAKWIKTTQIKIYSTYLFTPGYMLITTPSGVQMVVDKVVLEVRGNIFWF